MMGSGLGFGKARQEKGGEERHTIRREEARSDTSSSTGVEAWLIHLLRTVLAAQQRVVTREVWALVLLMASPCGGCVWFNEQEWCAA